MPRRVRRARSLEAAGEPLDPPGEALDTADESVASDGSVDSAEEAVDAVEPFVVPLDDSAPDGDRPGDDALEASTAGEAISGSFDEVEEPVGLLRGRGLDPVRVYLNEIGRHDLLDREAEARLGRAVQDGLRARRRLESREPLEPGEPRKLRRATRAGEVARLQFVEANLRLVVSIAKRYQHHGLDLADLIQEGNIGLMRAVEHFDWKLGFKFSTYATWWIRQAITRAIANFSSTVRLPVHAREQAGRLVEAADRLEARLGRAPTVRDLARETGLDEDRVSMILSALQQPVSLSSPVGDDRHELGDSVPDPAAGPEREATADVFSQELACLLTELSPTEAMVLRLRYGLGGGEPRALADVAATLSVSRERVRQIEGRALARLRHRHPLLASA